MPISRPNFVELCRRLTAEDERVFEDTHRRLGLSYDWRHQYTTIGERARRTSQVGFLKMLERGEAYRHEAPTLWDVDFRTAVAQAELEDREQQGAYYRIAFARAPMPVPPSRSRQRGPSSSPPAWRSWRTLPTTGTGTCSAPTSSLRCSACASQSSPTTLPSPRRARAIRT